MRKAHIQGDAPEREPSELLSSENLGAVLWRSLLANTADAKETGDHLLPNEGSRGGEKLL